MQRSYIVQRLAHARRLFASDSLFRNATYLMASTAVMSLLGFLFWIFVAHLYSPIQIGIATALIAITTLLSNLSLLGINSGLIRFLPMSKTPNRDINASTLVVAGVTLFAASLYVLFGVHLGGNITVLTSSWHKFAFVILMVAVSLNSLTDAVFISNRRAEYHTLGYATFGVVKLILPLVLIPFGAIGIFGAYILAMISSLFLSYYLLWRGCGYTFRAKPNFHVIKKIRAYSTHNYIGTVLGGLPSQILPVFIIKDLGAAQVGYFSMAWTMANLLYIIPSAAAQSLLAESSNDPRKQAEHIKRTIKILSLVLMPVVTIAVVVAPYLLRIFGGSYQQNGTTIFQIMALATFPFAFSIIANTILNIERRSSNIITVQVVTLTTTFVAAVRLIHHGLAGVGLAMLLGNIASSLTHYWIYRRNHSRRPRTKISPTARAVSAFPDTQEHIQKLLQPYGIHKFTYVILANGSNNRTLLVQTTDQKLVLRIYLPNVRDNADIEHEIAFMEHLRASGLPVPGFVANKHGQTVSSIALCSTSWQYIVMEFVEGVHPARYSTGLLGQMAHLQGLIHISGQAYAKTIKPNEHGWSRAHWWKRALLTNKTQQGYSHFDYDATNVLVVEGHIRSILDFEGMRYGPLVACVYYTLSQIYTSEPDVHRIKQYMHTYQQVRPLSVFEKVILSIGLAFQFKNLKLMTVLVA